MRMPLENKNAIVYGGSGSVGGTVARSFAREGASVLLAGDRDGVCTEESIELFSVLPNTELAVAPASDHGFIEAKAGLFDALALDFLMRHRNDSARVSR
jgi:3-oxoacyl-[acyl-carrier protein] reductase